MLDFSSWILGIERSLLSFETSQGGMLLGIAQGAITAIGIVLVIMFAVRAVQSLEHGQALPMSGLMLIGGKLAICGFVVAYWIAPAPGIGPIGTWIPNQGLHIAQMIGWSGAQTVAQNINSWSGMETPLSILSIGWVWVILAKLLLLLASVLLAIVLVGPLMFIAVMILIGPIFVPMWPVPELTGYARGYLRCLVTYSLIPVIAAASLWIVAQILLPSMSGFMGQASSLEQALPSVFLLCVSLIVSLWGMMECISRANHIMSGSGGSGLGWFTGGIAAAKAFLI